MSRPYLSFVLSVACSQLSCGSSDPPAEGAPADVAANEVDPGDDTTGEVGVDTGDIVDAKIDCSPDGGSERELACTGLYSDWGTRTIAVGVHELKPGFELWSDGATKRRWLLLPVGQKIDVTDPNEWVYPVGTKIWKEFTLPVSGAPRRVETRFLEKTSATTWRRATFVWSADGTSAPEVTDGVPLVAGTDNYSVPPASACVKCHGGRADNVLGIDAVLMAAPEATGLTWTQMQALGLLTSTNGNHAIPAAAFAIPGNTTERAALGLLHVNCGVSCHNANNPGARFDARIDVAGGKTPALFATGTYLTTINRVSTFRPKGAGPELHYRVRPGDVAHSTIAHRMGVRDGAIDGGASEQMPSLATNAVDDAGLATIKKWIGDMSPDAGYPDAATLDGGPIDTSVAIDTSPADTTLADTTLADTTVTDTSVTDTSAGDSGTCPLPPLKLTLMPGTYTQPLFVGAPPGDATRLFVVEKGGTIRLVKSGALLATPFLTLSDWYVPSASSEGGLLGLAFHPSYATNGRFFVHYTRSPSGNVVIREFRRSATNPDVADPTPVKTLLDTSHGGWNHVGGMLAFDASGLLYAAVGDRASVPSPARDLANPYGKILRYDVDSTTPPAGNMTGAGVFPYIWDYGLRNPWRFSFDRLNGTLYIGDVGQGAYEEIDVEPAGAGRRDYGWDKMEGTACYPIGSTCTPVGVPPAVVHSHASGEGGSITGGYVYRGAAIPCLRGRYVYADYSTARVFSFVWNGSSATSRVELTSDLNPGGSVASRIASFGEDANGELYVVNIFPGRVYRVDPE